MVIEQLLFETRDRFGGGDREKEIHCDHHSRFRWQANVDAINNREMEFLGEIRI